MTVAVTYDAVLSRVRISATSLPAHVDFALFERSTNNVTWTTVRGGTAVPVVSGAASLDDYEFAGNVVNYYRVSGVDTGPITPVGTPAGVTGNNTSLVVPLTVATKLPGDLTLILASIRNSGAGVPVAPAGWTTLLSSGNVAVFGRRFVTGDTDPTVTFTGGVLNADTLGQSVTFRNAELLPAASLAQLNGSAQDIAFPALTVPGAGHLVVVAGWKQDDWTSVATLAGMTEIGETISAAGDDAAQVWDRVIQIAAANIAAGSFTVTSGVAAISRGATLAFAPAAYVVREQTTITPNLASVWIKSLIRPFLNRAVTVVGSGEVGRSARNGVFPVVGRSLPVAVTDTRSGRSLELEVMTSDEATARDLDLCLSAGDPVFVHVPADCTVPGLYDMYAVIGDVSYGRGPSIRGARRYHQLPLTEVVAPGSGVVGSTVTWQNVVSAFGTWSALITEEPTWHDVLERIGDPVDVITP